MTCRAHGRSADTRSIKNWAIFDKQSECIKESLKKNFQGSHIPTKKSATKMRQRKKDTWVEMFLMEGSSLRIKSIQKTGENDVNELWINDSWHNEGTICLVNEWMGFPSMGTWTGAIQLVMVGNLVPRIGGADFLHCGVTDST